MAHSSFELLKELIKALDSQENDIYIHLDAKIKEVDINDYCRLLKQSNIYIISNRVNVSWGHVSLVEATLNLLEASIGNNYDYYHLLSGVDFPIKSNRFIQDFFNKNKGKEFVGFDNKGSHDKITDRIMYYHFINVKWIRNSKFWYIINNMLISIQKILHIHHHFPTDSYSGGSEWFSITDHLAKDLVKNRDFFLSHYKYTLIPDEIFLQTFIINNDKYSKSLYNIEDEYLGSLRAIDWRRGNPYVWKDEDLDYLLKSPYLFARKFSESNMDLIRNISKAIS